MTDIQTFTSLCYSTIALFVFTPALIALIAGVPFLASQYLDYKVRKGARG